MVQLMTDERIRKIEEKIIASKGIQLDIGCGRAKQPGWLGMDKRPIPEADVMHDMEDVPWPLPTSCAHTILCSHVLEHIDPRNFLAVMAEMHRVAADGCQILISTPYAGSFGGYQDPTHTRPGFNEATWTYFDPRPIRGNPNHLYSIYEPPPMFQERVHWDPNGNMEVVLKVHKNPVTLAKLLPKKVKKGKK